jgi:site-specific DNA recombinase
MSTREQEHSIEQQKLQTVPYATQRGYEVVGEYEDRGIAGDVFEDRPGFQHLLRDAAGGKFDVIVTNEPSRLSRQGIIDFISTVVRPLRDAGVTLDSVSDGPQGWDDVVQIITLTVRQDRTSDEVCKMSRRVIGGMLEYAMEGQPLGGKPPYGMAVEYGDKVRKGRIKRVPVRLMPGDPRKVECVRLIFHLCGDRQFSLDMIARELFERGFPNPQGGRHWGRPTLRRILRNRKYVGDMTWNMNPEGKYNEVVEGAVKKLPRNRRGSRGPGAAENWVVLPGRNEAIIDRPLFERAQVRLARNRGRTSPAPNGGDYPLTGLLICGDCGCRLIGKNARGKRLYLCGKYHNDGRHACHGNGVMESRVLGAIVGKLQDVILNPENLQRLRDEVRRQEDEERRERPGRQAELERQIRDLAQKIDRGTERMALVDIDLMPEFAAKVRSWKEERARLTAQLDEVRKPTQARADLEEVIRVVEDQITRLRDAVVEGEPSLVRAVLREMVSKVEMHFEQVSHGKRNHSVFVRGIIHVRGMGQAEECSDLITAANRPDRFRLVPATGPSSHRRFDSVA